MLLFLVGGIAFTAGTATKVIGVMGAVYAILQALKKTFPALAGWYAVALNALLSIVGVLVVVPPERFFSLDTLTTAIIALITAMGAAGIHGTVSTLGPKSS